jgi:amino acid adenylation domain-containing protein
MTGHDTTDDRAARLQRAIQAKKTGARGPGRGLDLAARPADAPAPLGEMQRGLWVVHQLDPGSPAYNLCSAFRVTGALDVPRLQQAFDRVVARHRLLRSTFQADGDTARQVVHAARPLTIARVEAGDEGALAVATREARRPFDLAQGPLVRVHLIEEASGHSRLLLLVLHHILADERSLACLWKEVAQAYDGRLEDAPPAAQYDDYVHWLGQADPGRRDEDLAFWRAHLATLPEDLRLPFEHPSSSGHSRGRLIERPVRTSVQAGIRRLASAAGATPFMIYAFVFRLLLHRYTQGQRVAFATPISTRSHPATAEMVGYFLNPLVVATTLDEQQPVGSCVEHFCTELRTLLAHASLPFDVLATAVSPQREADRHPIFQAMFVYQESGPAPVLGGVSLEPITLDLGASKFDLTLLVAEGDAGLHLAVEYRADRFDDVWMEALLGHYETLLEHVPEDRERFVHDVPMLDAAEVQRVSAWERGPRLDGPAIDLLPRQILAQTLRQPQAPAVTCGAAGLGYDELETTARSIAAALRAGGVTAGDRVALFLPRSTSLIAGVVGSHLAGAAYVPMDPSYPEARNRDLLADADVAAVLTTSALASRLPAGPWPTIAVDALEHDAASAAAVADLSPESVAYILYTSGSTGRPKGVVITHEHLRRSTQARVQSYDTPPGRFLLLPSPAFDSSVAGLFWTLATGGTLVVPTDDEARDARRLAHLVAEQRVTSLLCVPSLYAQLLQVGGDRLRGLQMVIVAGESCPSRLAADHFASLPHVRLFNEYGPTEATVWATVHEVTPADAARPVAIGRPIPGVRVEVLDDLGRRVAAGIPGHGWIVGPTVADGYWRRRDLTDERFGAALPGQEATQRRYRTGDRMAWTADGRLLFLGRDDEQIKLRGFRIEPGEIEAALLEHLAITQAAVVVHGAGEESPGSGEGEPAHLVAFVVAKHPGSLDGWRQALAGRLPEHMVPSRLVELPGLPTLPNGKIARRRLQALPLPAERRSPDDHAVPSTREHALLSLWEGLLGRTGLAVSDNFFELGGHSLQVLQMVTAIEQDFEVTLSATDVFQHPTVRDLARWIAQRRDAQAHTYQHLFPIQPSGRQTPLVIAGPDVFASALAARFRGERPVYGLRGISPRPEGNRGRWPTMTDLAEEIVEEMRRRFPDTPCILAGYSFGAWLAIEVVRVMEARGYPVQRLYVIVPMPLDFYRLGPFRVRIDGLRRPLAEHSTGELLGLYLRGNHPLTRAPYRRARQWLTERPWRRLLSLIGGVRRWWGLPLTPRLLQADVRVERFRLHAQYRPGTVHTPTVVFNASGTPSDAAATWRPHFLGPFTVHPTPDPHDAASVDAARAVVLQYLEAEGAPAMPTP